MALVAYDNSDSSDYDEDEESNSITLNQKPEAQIIQQSTPTENEAENSLESGPNLFNLLPQPSSKKPAVVEEDDEFLHKKETVTEAKPKAKISVPSLSDFKDVESTSASIKPKTSSAKKSGLLSMLPQPRNAVTASATKPTMIPHVLTQKPKTDNVKKKPLPSPAKKLKTDKPLITDYSDESDDEDVQNDFFSINKPVEVPDLPIPEVEPPKPVAVENTPRGIESYFKKDIVDDQVVMETDDQSISEYAESEAGASYNGEASESVTNEELVLDEEAILKLCGARGKRKREEIQIVDVNQQEVLANAREMLLRGLMDDTTKRVSSSKKRGHEPTSQQKRKHQITYLAHQAKANEAELQNQWANNRMSKRKTQSKYGF